MPVSCRYAAGAILPFIYYSQLIFYSKNAFIDCQDRETYDKLADKLHLPVPTQIQSPVSRDLLMSRVHHDCHC